MANKKRQQNSSPKARGGSAGKKKPGASRPKRVSHQKVALSRHARPGTSTESAARGNRAREDRGNRRIGTQTGNLAPIHATNILLPLLDERFSWETFEQFCEHFIGV